MLKNILSSLVLAALISIAPCCGGGGYEFPEDVPSGAPPFISRIDPTSGAIGDTITIFGFGFSATAPMNVIIIGDTSSSADEYTLLDNPIDTEIESLTLTVPDGLTAGDQSIFVVVYENVSNADLMFTVTP